ncbi:hypothetical protein [Litorihabitans aurantiacus]|nr:hypothetical protein [Litorihabitans aurantiacus]
MQQTGVVCCDRITASADGDDLVDFGVVRVVLWFDWNALPDVFDETGP